MTKMTKKSSDYYVSKKDLTPTKINPWSRELVHTMKKGAKITGFAAARHDIVNSETGEVVGDVGAVVGTRKIVDKEEFVKFFGAGLVEAFSLSKGAQDVFKTILHAYLEANTLIGRPDQIYITHEVAKEDLGYSRSKTTFTSGINELCLKEFMNPVDGRDGFYWLNPNLFYKGDRMRIVREFVLDGSESHQQIKALENQPEKENG